jgi:cell division protein FtsZ
MVKPGLINLDFADVRSVMDEMGKAMMGTGEAEGPDRATHAAEKAIANPLLDEISLKGAKGVLINITGGYDMTLFELDEAANKIREMVDEDANIIVGSTLDPEMSGKMRVSVVATGIDASGSRMEPPMPRRSMAAAPPPRMQQEEPRQAPAARQPAPQPVVARQPAPVAPRPVPVVEEEPAFEARDFEPEVEEFDVADDLPPPAYRPAQQPAARAEPVAEAPAPRAAAPGTPTPEALARLRAMATRAAEARSTEQPRPAATPAAPAQAGGEKPRFGINSLINRMTGTPAEGTTTAAAPAPRPAQPRYEAQPEAEGERADIPAFLRRQAN